MIPIGQTDLTYHGTFYSIVVIILMNLLLLAGLLILISPNLSFHDFLRALLIHGAEFSHRFTQLLSHLMRMIHP